MSLGRTLVWPLIWTLLLIIAGSEARGDRELAAALAASSLGQIAETNGELEDRAGRPIAERREQRLDPWRLARRAERRRLANAVGILPAERTPVGTPRLRGL